MFSVARRTVTSRTSTRAFSSTPSRAYDLAKLTLIGRMGKDPEQRTTQSGNEYYHYTVATENFPPPPLNAEGKRPPATVTWHSVLSFSPNANNFLKNVKKGSRVFVEANYEVRDPDPHADSSTAQGQRQIFLRHENIRILNTAHSEKTHEE
ncbi:single-strand binding protein family-domain-containing protein [Cristinia sonorae]|uniref:Single-strand binding protein family-domain-containing protein n=1 Tax=Cristinia sonorae TaxID=1940300 RepID=A0A8K0UXX2_9AGAR|nr:single-strand binding protein family-domain-containing protein [Cristinia sonorae]